MALTLFSIGGLLSFPSGGDAAGQDIANGGTFTAAHFVGGDLSAGNGKASINAQGSLRIDGQNGQYPLEVRDAAGAAYVFRVINGSGECQSKGEFSTDAGFRVTTFGAYCGVQLNTRLTFNNHYIAARTARLLIDTGEAAADDGATALQVAGSGRFAGSLEATGTVSASGFVAGGHAGQENTFSITDQSGTIHDFTFFGGLLASYGTR